MLPSDARPLTDHRRSGRPQPGRAGAGSPARRLRPAAPRARRAGLRSVAGSAILDDAPNQNVCVIRRGDANPRDRRVPSMIDMRACVARLKQTCGDPQSASSAARRAHLPLMCERIFMRRYQKPLDALHAPPGRPVHPCNARQAPMSRMLMLSRVSVTNTYNGGKKAARVVIATADVDVIDRPRRTHCATARGLQATHPVFRSCGHFTHASLLLGDQNKTGAGAQGSALIAAWDPVAPLLARLLRGFSGCSRL